MNVRQSVLRWAAERAPDRDAVQRRFPKLDDWLLGITDPTLRQLEEFARATATPFGYLFFPEPPTEQLPIPHYRTLRDNSIDQPSADLIETVQVMQRRQEWMREYLIEQGQEALPFVSSVDVGDSIEPIAESIRTTLGVDGGWAEQQSNWSIALRELQKAIEDTGILVAVNGIVGNNTHRVLNVAEFRGFVLVDEYAPLIFVNGADGKAAQMFTLAHELAHIWYGSSAVFDLRQLQPADDPTELASDRTAAEFLIPTAEFEMFWPSVQDQRDRFRVIARRYKVSEIVAARRAQDIALISQNEFFDFYNGVRDRERTVSAQDGGGGDFYNNQNLRLGRRFTEAVVRAVGEGKLLHRDAYGLTDLYGRTFEEYARRVAPGVLR